LATVATSGKYTDLTGTPVLAPVATAGTYASLTGQPTQLSQFANNINTFATLTTPGTLNVSGNSTLAATTMTSNTISGNETVTGNLTVNGITNLAATTISGLTLTGPVTGTPLNGVYNSSTAVTNSKIIYFKGTTTQGQVTFYPTTTATSSGTAIFSTLLNVQANAVLATTSGGSCPCTSIYSASTTSIVINCVVAASGNVVANGTVVYATVTGY